jgi:hypothetical protein
MQDWWNTSVSGLSKQDRRMWRLSWCTLPGSCGQREIEGFFMVSLQRRQGSWHWSKDMRLREVACGGGVNFVGP